MLEVSNLRKEFGDNSVAVDDVSFSVSAGTIYSLIGPNGSGKTTIIKMIAGLLQPTGGTVMVDGVDTNEDPEAAKSRIGLIPDKPKVWDKMTGREFLHFTGALYGMDPQRREERIQELLPIFSLSGVGDMYFEYYSRGNRQKFTILAALLHEPDVLLIDEPIIGLDPESVEILEGLLRDFRDGGGAVLITTHILDVAEHITDEVGVLSAGQLKASDSLAVLKERADLSHEAPLKDVYSAFSSSPLQSRTAQ